MRTIYLLLLSGLMALSASAEIRVGSVEQRVKSDLEEILAHVLPKGNAIVHVFATYESVTERKVVEGETLSQQAAQEPEVVVAPLPGFQPVPKAPTAQTPPSQNREWYKEVEKEVLKMLSVQVSLNEALDSEVIAHAKDVVQKYLLTHFRQKSVIEFTLIRMHQPTTVITPTPEPTSAVSPLVEKSEELADWVSFVKERPWILALAAFLILLLVSGIIVAKKRSRRAKAAAVPAVSTYTPLDFAQTSSMASERSKEVVVDHRLELLSSFLNRSDIFRLYFERLAESSRKELAELLKGPAFDSLLDALHLARPTLESSENANGGSNAEKIQFYIKDFSEFVTAQVWQKDQFFGFLQQITQEQLSQLLQEEEPLAAAVLLKMIKTEQSAKILGSLTSEKRLQLLAEFPKVPQIRSDELHLLEERVRLKVERLPKLIASYNREEVEFWTKILLQSENQEQILSDLEKTMPGLYPLLARFRFKLEDIGTLAPELISQVVNDIENEDLAKALVGCSPEITEVILAQLGAERRQLISSQMVSMKGLAEDEVKKAKAELTLKLRKVIV